MVLPGTHATGRRTASGQGLAHPSIEAGAKRAAIVSPCPCPACEGSRKRDFLGTLATALTHGGEAQGCPR